MSGEKQNREHRLGEKLDSLLSLPGEPAFNKEAAWDRIYDRLGGPAVARFPKYRVAAACLLLSVSVFFWMKQSPGRQDRAGNRTETVRQALPSGRDKSVRQDGPAIVPSIAKKTVDLSGQRNRVRQKSVAPPSLLARSAADRPGTDSSRLRALVPATISFTLPATEISHPVASTPKKKLRVVHLNELDEPAETENVAQYSTRHLFRIKWSGYPGAVNGPAVHDHPLYETLRINLSSPN
jgi:hypothetical protein